MHHIGKNIFNGLIVILLLAACDPKVAERGKQELAEAASQISVGETTKQEVVSLLGTPSAVGQFGDKSWYYVSQRKEGVAFFAPEVVDSQVLRIQFKGDLVAGKQQYDSNDTRDVSFSDRQTPTEGQSYGFFEQLIGNIGKFNKQQDSVR